MDDPILTFYGVFAWTLVAIATTAWLGATARRRAHLAAAVVTAASLVLTVYLAERLGQLYVMPRAALGVHLVFANSGVIAFVVVALTGIALWRGGGPKRRRRHRRAVIAFVVIALGAAATGAYMVSGAEPFNGDLIRQ